MASSRWSFTRVLGGPAKTQPPSNHSTSGPSHTNGNSRGHGPRQHQRQASSATTTVQPQSRFNRPPAATAAVAEDPNHLSNDSTPAVPDSVWFASDFMLGSGMAIIQPSSGKVVILCQREKDRHGREHSYWFLPKGRKDVGESLEQTALREAYEESGYRVSMLPVVLPHNAPNPPGSIRRLDRSRILPCTEPIYISLMGYGRGGRNHQRGEYLTFWYVGQIPADATVEAGTRMADEVDYETHLVTIQEALARLQGPPAHVMHKAYELWTHTAQLQAQNEYRYYVSQLAVEHARAAVASHGARPAGADEVVSAEQAAQDAENWEDADLA
ncbi:hypothetical protein BD310DRAFT_876361 [Dichomitus squalens]|uniref:Nudix hydrolase domain-containing protein n=1 Tax=Dichomitus squalens TaxID=114155 RepID=A0A4Q9Q061_9APHY|nr:hypothetical protein BD310DRAFT_876361 [Dichomitus squalens]